MGFERFKDADTGRTFLYNASTGETKWDSPALIPGRDVLSPITNNSNEENSGSGRIEGVEMTSMSRLEAGVISSVDPNLYDDSESETEAAVMEGWFKTFFYLTISLILNLVGILLSGFSSGSSIRHSAFLYFRESILFLFSTLTLMVPCSASCTVYAGFRSEEDWKVRAIPTCIGYVDPRRYYIFESGDCEMAKNQYKPGSGSLDSWR
ncbi:hypothetical protein TL16_g02608 [Triparma laevis f. inornata]|uniref:WW domain-containing protein n=1 Tax=Triparma laevis f. inornata TaxID=1714386 RepID=A0A9W6ZXV0_9STRA|nr:hypothetical protein TL16_g02608 [Triparma laevis f. inornata]